MGAYSAPPDHIAGFQRAASQSRKSERGRMEREEKRKEAFLYFLFAI